ncbi:MAG TPA: metalloregulator ArsR/SmtB family transcription factor [Anaerolineaceae bacterium]|jgi:ArsR family transcriptional regulator
MIDPSQADPLPFEIQAQYFKVLTHPARLAILEILRDGEHCVCHLEAHLGFRQAFISQHLAVLREAGLILDRRDGWNIFYRIADPGIYAVLDSVRELTGQAELSVGRAGVKCPCPHCNPQAAKERKPSDPERAVIHALGDRADILTDQEAG